jgi:hypothetical protein
MTGPYIPTHRMGLPLVVTGNPPFSHRISPWLPAVRSNPFPVRVPFPCSPPFSFLLCFCTCRATFTTAAAIDAYLPATGTAGIFTTGYTNPTATSAGVFGGQVLALKLSVDFSNAMVPRFSPFVFGSLLYCNPTDILTYGNSVT